ncbi:DUF4232 domain-containing protein [Amycolatopsis samaneae]|uniref:DUF4232 domain-containing protein n=1 Tax=Amycolatopsis samaneae TaxID=664691 RepID=A0ABW5GIG7_9PSEU
MGINAKVIKRGVLAIAAVAAVGALGACSTGQAGSASPAPQGSGAVGGGIGAAPNGGGAAANEAAIGGGVANAGNKIPCTALRVAASTPQLISGEQYRVPLTLTNNSDATCSVNGFPGVQLTGVDGTTWDLARTNGALGAVVLRPGEHAVSNLTYLGTNQETGWEVASMKVTPPNTYNTQPVEWTPGIMHILKQDGATHPGTYIDPVRPAK